MDLATGRTVDAEWHERLRGSLLPSTVKLVAWALASHGDSVTASYPQIAAWTGLGKRTVQGAVRALEGSGWLHVQRGVHLNGGSAENVYRLASVAPR